MAPGDLIDGFRVEELLYVGGMATLWRVSRGDLERPALMKLPNVRKGEHPAAIVGFEMERMILPRLSGPHVPQFVAAGDMGSQPNLVMERVAGDSLRGHLDRLPLSWSEVVRVGTLVSQAVEALHNQQVLHLDLKPSNVILRH